MCQRLLYFKFYNEIHHFKNKNISKNSHRESAGIAIIVDENIDKKILITQSYNNLWGIPKGKKESNETLLECASREVVEESGIKVDVSSLKSCEEIIFIPNYDKKLTIHIFKYFLPFVDYISYSMNNLCLKDLHDDSTGFGWINLKCLNEITKAKTIKLNSLTKYILRKI